jgi:hypothetical protein
MASVKDLINEINDSRQPSNGGTTYETKSQKDELAVMKAMLNDKDYVVDVYGPNGVEGQYCPATAIRETLTSVVTNTTGISEIEAKGVIDNYEFKSSEAKGLIDLSKEFVNTYLQTGRKLPLGGREKSNVSMIRKVIPAGMVKYPVKVGEDSNGRSICQHEETYVDGYQSIRVYGPCPSWIKNKGKKD